MLRKRGSAVLMIILAAVVATVLSIFGSGSIADLNLLRQSVNLQRQRNQQLGENVTRLREEVVGLESDDRVLEKAARRELGMARPDELIFIFDKKEGN